MLVNMYENVCWYFHQHTEKFSPTYFTKVHLNFFLHQHSENSAPTYFTNITTPATRSASDENGGYGLALCRDERNIITHSNTTVGFKAAEDFCKLRTGSYGMTHTV